MSTKRSMVRLNAARKRQAVVECRASGGTWAECMVAGDYSSPEAAMRAFNDACARLPQQNVEELIRGEEARLEQCDAQLARIIASPPIKTTSIGRTQWDVRTCVCETKAATSREHDSDCTVQPVLDQGVVIQAVKERRLIGESLRRLRGADKRPEITLDEFQREVVAHWAKLEKHRELPYYEVEVIENRDNGTLQH
jgi:hypothetical protein